MTVKDSAGKPLRIGAFYWALPARDPDAYADWQNKYQPALFAGYAGDDRELWFWLGVEGDLDHGVSDWPARSVLKEINPPRKWGLDL